MGLRCGSTERAFRQAHESSFIRVVKWELSGKGEWGYQEGEGEGEGGSKNVISGEVSPPGWERELREPPREAVLLGQGQPSGEGCTWNQHASQQKLRVSGSGHPTGKRDHRGFRWHIPLASIMETWPIAPPKCGIPQPGWSGAKHARLYAASIILSFLTFYPPSKLSFCWNVLWLSTIRKDHNISTSKLQSVLLLSKHGYKLFFFYKELEHRLKYRTQFRERKINH